MRLRTRISLCLTYLCMGVLMSTNSGCTSSTHDPIQAYTEARLEHQEEVRDEAISSIPTWFNETANYSPHGVAGKGTAISTDLQTALDHAHLNAQVALAGEINTVVSEQMIRYRTSYSSYSEAQDLISTTSDRYIPETNIGGARVIRQHVVAEGNGFRAYILVFLDKPLHQINQIVKTSLNQAHQELMKRNERYRSLIEKERMLNDAFDE